MIKPHRESKQPARYGNLMFGINKFYNRFFHQTSALEPMVNVIFFSPP